MRMLVFVLTICLYGSCYLLQCQSVSDENKAQTPSPPPQDRDLSVKAEIITQNYCHVDNETFSVQMDIKLRFTNVSDRPVVLARRIESPPIVRAAKTMRDAVNGNFEYEPHPDYFVSELPRSPRFGDKPDSKYFAILAPQQSYDVRTTSGAIGALTSVKASLASGLLVKGSHVLQFGVETWPYQWPYFDSDTDVKQLSRRWSRYGHLARGLVYSDFLIFAIPDKFDNPACEIPAQK